MVLLLFISGPPYSFFARDLMSCNVVHVVLRGVYSVAIKCCCCGCGVHLERFLTVLRD